MVLTLPPSAKTVAARKPPMPEAIIAYSIAVAPLSSAQKRANWCWRLGLRVRFDHVTT